VSLEESQAQKHKAVAELKLKTVVLLLPRRLLGLYSHRSWDGEIFFLFELL